MAIELISKIAPKNNGSFALVDAKDVLVDESSNSRLDGYCDLVDKIHSDLYNYKTYYAEQVVIDNYTDSTFNSYKTSGTMRGWCTTLGKPSSISKLKLGFFARSGQAISNLKIRIYKAKIVSDPANIGGYAYTPIPTEVIYEGMETFNTPITSTSTTWLEHTLTTPITENTDWLMICYYTPDADTYISVTLYEKTFDDIPQNFYALYTSNEAGSPLSAMYSSTAVDWLSKTVLVLPVIVYGLVATADSPKEPIIDTTEAGKFFNAVTATTTNIGLTEEEITAYYNSKYGTGDLFAKKWGSHSWLSSTFSGVCWDIGRIPSDFKIEGFRIPVLARKYNDSDGIATKLWCTLYEIDAHPLESENPTFNSLNPVVLAKKEVDINVNSISVTPVDIIFDKPVYNQNNKVLALGYNINHYFEKVWASPTVYPSDLINEIEGEETVTENLISWYSTKQESSDTWANKWVEQSPAWCFITTSKKVTVGETIKDLIIEAVDDLDLSGLQANSQRGEVRLAKQYDLVVGDTFQLFYSGCLKSFECLNADSLGIKVKCAKGSQYPRYYEWTPTASDVGTYSLSISIRNFDGSIMSEATTNLVVHDIPTYDTETSLYTLGFGDSLTNSGVWYGEGLRRLVGMEISGVSGPASLQVPNLSITSYGKKNNTNNTYKVYHEGYGGWTWASFLATSNATSTTNGIVATLASAHGYDLDTVQKSEWTDNNNKKWELEDFPSDTQIKFNRGSGNNAAQSATSIPTSLTCSSLGLSITPTMVAWESGNPFYDEELEEINFVTHATECGAPTCDIAAVLLSWNGGGGSSDMQGMSYQSKIDTHLGNATDLIRKFHTDFPNAKLIVMGIQISSLNGGMGYNYGAIGTYSDTWASAFYAYDYNKALEELVTNSEFGEYCYYCDTKAQFDTINMMPYTSVVVNTRSTTKEIRGSNGVHPSTGGYYQIGDAFFRTLVRVLNDIKEEA